MPRFGVAGEDAASPRGDVAEVAKEGAFVAFFDIGIGRWSLPPRMQARKLATWAAMLLGGSEVKLEPTQYPLRPCEKQLLRRAAGDSFPKQ